MNKGAKIPNGNRKDSRPEQTLQARPNCGRCGQCGERGLPRGSWSPYFCEQCDIERLHRISHGMSKITGNGAGAHDMEWYIAKSAEIADRKWGAA